MSTKNPLPSTETELKHPPFGMRDKIGYMMGDLANDMTFIFAASFLMIFYTNVWGIPSAMVGTLFLVARAIDAFTDVAIGRLVDRRTPGPEGKFKPWIRWFAGPVALAAFLLYQTGLQDMSLPFKIVYMYVTYILWGSITYTAVNIPYGSMASAITADPQERTELSTFRTVGATLAILLIGTLTPLFIYTKSEAGTEVVRTDHTFTIIALVFSLLAVTFYFIFYRLTTERVKYQVDKNKPQLSMREVFGAIFKSRALFGIILAALFLILAQLVIGQMNTYLFPVFFNSGRGTSITNFVNPILILVIAAPFAPLLAKRFGKKEMASTAMLGAAVVYLLLFILKIHNMYVYIAIAALAYVGFGLFNTVIWAKITDVIDDLEVKSHERSDGTVYALYSFARKIGQAIAGGIAGYALQWINYDGTQMVQAEGVPEAMYNLATIVPAVAFALSALSLIFIYPLSKRRVKENSEILSQRRK